MKKPVGVATLNTWKGDLRSFVFLLPSKPGEKNWKMWHIGFGTYLGNSPGAFLRDTSHVKLKAVSDYLCIKSA